MTYQVLARKWRPKDFASLVGQEHVVRALTHALDGGRLHHAYLFTGTRGVGKTTLSRIFAKALNCETGVTSTPCGVCRACREIDEGRFVDYVEMDAASNRGVDEMAALLERAVYAPVDARFKVYMIDEVHMLTNHAFNAMLKTLEEPPPHVKFILATTDPQKIPVTVLSRCLQFNLKQMPAGHIVSHLERILGEESVPHEAQALRLLARAADGSMRDALSLTDQAIAYSANQVSEDAVRGMLGALDQSYLIRLLDALAQGDGAAVLAVADEMALRSLSFSTALQDLASLLHRIAWAQFAPSSVLDEWPEAADLRRFADALSAEQVQLFYQIATIGRSELGLAPDEYAGFTMTLLRMLAFEPAPTGGGGGAAGAAGTQSGAGGAGAGAQRSGAPTVAALRALSPSSATAMAAAAPVRGPQVSVAGEEQGDAMKSTAPTAKPIAKPAADSAQSEEAPQSPNAEVARVTDAPAITAPQLAPWEDAPANAVATIASSSAPVSNEVSDIAPSSAPSALATAAPGRAEEATSPEPEAQPELAAPASTAAPAAAADSVPRRAGGASAALDVLRNAGMKVSSDRGRANTAVPAKPAAPKPAAPKPAAPRVVVPAPTPGASRRESQDTAAQAAPARDANSGASSNAQQNSPSIPPWDDMPPDDYLPLSAADDAYFIPPDDDFVPVFDRGPDDVRMDGAAAQAAAPAPLADTRPLPPAVPLDPLGFTGDWPALAVDLPLKGISYQLAFNSELMALDGSTLKLNVPVPQYAEASQVAKLKAALVERLGQNVDVQVEVGPARRTAAAHDAKLRAQRQQEAEREISADPFVQSLIREFGASIVPGSICPITPDAAPNGASPAH
ncbi:DNA polymerase III subunit gamma/tau [Paraburkholderia sp. MM5384-R2]|uniref:DNA polymerase III subunit gamma/tau n=1 Tax=Paraburkholderia sp. MM5384-R2 TaxID=2723097 RepID=UPI00161D66B2|nr:DNA polymerase III subunit gamma/tau [Paraburkholderia sp. MM5384-R2]MBB5496213.1 DNA polymerase-3 subunit gamma/tau [Paraburkholderia sp. MM5384-R2]